MSTARLAADVAVGSSLLIEGPAVIEEKTSTTVLYPGQRAVMEVEVPSLAAAAAASVRSG